MKVKLSQAVKMFFSNSSLEMVYFEAIANALDANSTEINISISTQALNKPETLAIEISDNGIGFTNDRYKQFSNLFDVEESSHKGLGRLVYLCYFDGISVISHFENTKRREFNFTENFEEDDNTITEVSPTNPGTSFKMGGYTLQKLAKYEFVQPNYLKYRILEHFYSRFFQLKNDEQPFTINIDANIENKNYSDTLTSDDIPDFTTIELESKINLIDKFHLHYSIQEVELHEKSLIAAISVDNRTTKIEIIADENIPLGYKMVFLLFSDFFIGKIDTLRQNLTITSSELQQVKDLFRREVASLIEKHIPQINERNKETKINLINRYPHLSGYFDSKNIGYISRNEVLKKAQEIFFNAQKELLDANSLNDEQFQKSIEISARALTEYILFRQLTINKLKNSTNENSEAELHKLFASMKTQFDKENANDDLYRNNAWLLDDKYMTYETVLSDKELGDLINFLQKEESERDNDRPDIALVFSNSPNENIPFDVVIVELKKRGLSLEDNMKVVTQLEKRARKLMQYYDNKIQRIWYYGIIEFNEDVEIALAGEYTELYSSGKMYYKETSIAISLNPKKVLPIGVFIWDLDAVVKDADARNSAFLNLIKEKFTE